jgi:hypothetical protein
MDLLQILERRILVAKPLTCKGFRIINLDIQPLSVYAQLISIAAFSALA